MNRETRRMLQRQRQVAEDGTPIRAPRQQQPQAAPARERTSPAQFAREVRGELRKVAWPTRGEVVNYSIIVLVTVVILTAFIAALDFGFAQAVLFLFGA